MGIFIAGGAAVLLGIGFVIGSCWNQQRNGGMSDLLRRNHALRVRIAALTAYHPNAYVEDDEPHLHLVHSVPGGAA